MKKQIVTFASTVLLFLCSPLVMVHAQTSASSGTLTNPLVAPDLATLLQEILGYVTFLGGIFLTFMLVYVGFKFVTAQGNPEAVSSAKSMLLWTAIGGLLLLGAQAIAIVITTTVASL